MNTIKLTELEFNKLLRLSEQYQRVQLEAKIQIDKINQSVKDMQDKALAYMKELHAMYEDFDPTASYNANEATFELVPVAPTPTPTPQA